jgi:hypothetical protein
LVYLLIFLFPKSYTKLLGILFPSILGTCPNHLNPLPLLFKSLQPGQEDRMIILSDFVRQTTESYSFIHTTQYIYEENTSTF